MPLAPAAGLVRLRARMCVRVCVEERAQKKKARHFRLSIAHTLTDRGREFGQRLWRDPRAREPNRGSDRTNHRAPAEIKEEPN